MSPANADQLPEPDIREDYRHPQAKADIVFVHGLNGSQKTTWTAKNDVCWPRDLLPASLRDEHANVLVYGYNSHVTDVGGKIPSQDRIDEHAETLVVRLTQFRKEKGTYRLPIIWVAHSLGGILTKSALLYSEDVRGPNLEDLRSIYVSTYGIIFLGTPHNGSSVANWGRALHHTLKVSLGFMIRSDDTLLKTLMKDSEVLRQINNRFLNIHQRFRIHMVHETLKTGPRGLATKIVDNSSAGPRLFGVTYYGIEATHSDMCKFASVDSPGYLTIASSIREWVADSPNVIPTRWALEEEGRRQRALLENHERARRYRATDVSLRTQQQTVVGGNKELSTIQTAVNETTTVVAPPPLTQSPESAQKPALPVPAQKPALPEPERRQARDEHEPRFVHPDQFRPNSFFIGREDELRALHEMLMDRRRRSEGTSAVLIHCLPGGGKTHLARQYVFKHKDDYPGGIYWVRAKSRHDLDSWFSRFAEDEGLGNLTSSRDVEELRDTKKIVQTVRKWLNARSGWLMVFDGVHFDMPDLPDFIPDARHTSMIFTSTEQAVVGDPRFDNPQALELGLLTAEEARDLLLMEMDVGRRHPWTEDDRAMALELVQLMGRLPLMIHVAAQHLKATREPLARYLKSYRTRPKAGGLSAYKAVLEQLQIRAEYPALNLISLLAFFDQHLPLEMLMQGLDALDEYIPVKTRDAAFGKATLNNTLKVLIAFALIDRSDSRGWSPASSRSSKRSFDKYVDHLDLLRIHSVVQAFFIDSLREMRAIEYFLVPATDMWCMSYDRADARIQEEANVGLPDDYRRFSMHGQKLLQNVRRFESRYPAALGHARSRLEDRLDKIQGRIDSLSETIRKNIIEGSEGPQPTSVFDRISTSSQSGSSAMLISDDSQLSSDTSTSEEYYGELAQSPLLEELYEAAETPYPSIALMPAVPETSDDDQETVVLTASQTTETRLAMGTTEVADFTSVFHEGRSDHPQSDPYGDWQESIPHHRVIGRREPRRYRDRAGAWRDTTISDPRVGLNREVVQGSVSSRREASRSPVGIRLTAKSEAETELLKVAAPSPRASRGSFDSVMSRPETLPGTISSAQTAARPAELPSGFAQIIRTSVGNLKRVLSSRRLKDGAQSPVADAGAHPQQAEAPPEEDETHVPPASLFLGRSSRSANNSPANQASPFPPPSFSAIPTDELMAQPALPASVQRWETVAHYPASALLSSSEPDSADPDPMSHSYPTLPSRPQPHAVYANPAPQFWLHTEPPVGYSSEPMSRNGSHQSSNPSVRINPPVGPTPAQAAFARPSGTGGVLRSSASSPTSAAVPGPVPIPGEHHHHPAYSNSYPSPSNSAPAAGGGGGGHIISSRLSPFTRARPPSYTETEPSPRLETPFPDVNTSYRRWEQRHGLAAAAAGGRGSPTSGGSSGSGSPRSRLARATRISRGRGGSDGGGGGGRRAQSLSPRLSPSSPARARSPAPGAAAAATKAGLRPRSGSSGSPLPVPFPLPPGFSASAAAAAGGRVQVQYQYQHQYQHQHQHQHQHQQHPLAEEWPTPATDPGSPQVPSGGEPMVRSASGGSTAGAGIRVGYGVVQFGAAPGSSGDGAAGGGGGRAGGAGGAGGGRAGGGRSGSLPGDGTAGLGIEM